MPELASLRVGEGPSCGLAFEPRSEGDRLTTGEPGAPSPHERRGAVRGANRYRRYRVAGDSMEPTLVAGQRLLADGAAYAHHAPARYDLVVARDPSQRGTRILKRVVGLPGEEVSLDSGHVLINGLPLEEPYARVDTHPRLPVTRWLLDPIQILVLGDNRLDTRDSLTFGPLGPSDLVARVWFCYWPPRRWGRVRARP